MGIVDIFYDIDPKAEKVDVEPIILCVPDDGSEAYISGPDTWNFASECQTVGAIEISPTLEGIKVAKLRTQKVGGGKVKRRLWLRLSIAVGVDIAVTLSWRYDGCRVKGDRGTSFAKLCLKLDLPGGGLVNEFRAPIRPRESSGSNIPQDTLEHHLQTLHSPSTASPDPCPTPSNNQMRDGGVRSSCETHLVTTKSPSDHGSSASVGSGGIHGRKRGSDEANMGADDGFQAIQHARAPRALSQEPQGRYYQQSAFLPPPIMSPPQVQAANTHRNLLPATTRPEPAWVPAPPFRGSQATPDMPAMASRPQLSQDHLYSSQMWALNQLSGPGPQIYSVPRDHQPVTRSPGADSASTDPTCTYCGDSSPQVPQGIMPQSMQQHSFTHWPQKTPVRGTSGSEHVAGTQFQESTAPAGDVMIEGTVWFPTSGGPSWQGM
jgi:hypothetical protein